MRVSLTGFAVLCRTFGTRLAANLETAENQSSEEAKTVAESLSHGPLKTKDLRKRGHPYAVRSPDTGIDAAIINEQKRMFARSFSLESAVAGGGSITTRLSNTAPNAKYLMGTKWAIKRPIMARVATTIRESRKTRVANALHTTFLGG